MQQGNYQHLSKLACRPPQIPLYIGLFENKKGLELVSWPQFDKFYFVVLHKLTIFHYQTVFTLQVMFHA